MPFRRRGRRLRRRIGRRRRGRKFYKSTGRKAEVMVNRMPARYHTLVAPHYLTRLEAGYSGNIPAAKGPALNWDVWGTPYLPFDQGHVFTAASPGGVLVPATVALAALNAVGFTAMGNLYSEFRVFAAKLDVTVTPTAGADVSLLCVMPYGEAEVTTITDIQLAMSQPYAKCITVTGNNNVRQNRISLYIDAPTLYGYTKQQFMDSSDTIGNTAGNVSGAANPNKSIAFRIFQECLSGNALTAFESVEVRLTMWAEFLGPLDNIADT